MDVEAVDFGGVPAFTPLMPRSEESAEVAMRERQPAADPDREETADS